MSLQHKMAGGAFWSLLTKFGNQGISFVVFLVVARLIGPEQYGLASLCFVAFGVGNILLNGLADGLIALQLNDRARLSALFWLVVGAGTLLSLGCWLTAPLMAQWLDLPALQNLLEWFSPLFILMALAVLPNKLLYAQMRFRLFALRSISGALISAIAGIWLALTGWGALAIVVQQLVLYVVINLVIWLVVDWCPGYPDWRGLGHSLKPGLKAMASDSLEFAEQQLPRLWVSSVLGPIALGYLAFVMRLRYALQDIVINPPISVLYPAMSGIRDDIDAQRQLAGQWITLLSTLLFPLLTLAVVLAPDYMSWLFGLAWIGSVPLLQTFLAGAALLPISLTVRELLRSHARLGRYVVLQALALPVVILIYLLIIPHGLIQGALLLVALSWLMVPLQVWMLLHATGIALWSQLPSLGKPALAALLMTLGMLTVRHELADVAVLWRMAAAMGVGGAIYIATWCALFRRDVQALWGWMRARKGAFVG